MLKAVENSDSRGAIVCREFKQRVSVTLTVATCIYSVPRVYSKSETRISKSSGTLTHGLISRLKSNV